MLHKEIFGNMLYKIFVDGIIIFGLFSIASDVSFLFLQEKVLINFFALKIFDVKTLLYTLIMIESNNVRIYLENVVT